MGSNDETGDLGFRYRARKGGDVEITRDGKPVTLLHGRDAADFLAAATAPDADDDEIQQLLARRTGNYKRGNERHASEHQRNR